VTGWAVIKHRDTGKTYHVLGRSLTGQPVTKEVTIRIYNQTFGGQIVAKRNAPATATIDEETDVADDGEHTVNGEATEAAAPKGPSKSVKMREMFTGDPENGVAPMTRGDISKALGVTYQAVFAATKALTNSTGDQRGGRARIMMDDPDNEGAQISRAEYIRRAVLGNVETGVAGKTRGEVAKELGVPYQIVFAATKDLDLPKAPRKAAAAVADDEDEVDDATAELDEDEDNEEAEDEDDDETPEDESLFP